MALLKHPLPVFLISFVVLSLASWIGTLERRRHQKEQDVRKYGVAENSTLTLPGLIIAFTSQNLEILAESLRPPATKP